MSKFVFNKKNNLELDIAGNKFSIAYNEKLMHKINKTSKDISERIGKIKESKGNVGIFDELIGICTKVIDDICGEGATEKIFTNEEHTILDYCDVILYISEEINKFNKNVSNKYSVNRAVKNGNK